MDKYTSLNECILKLYFFINDMEFYGDQTIKKYAFYFLTKVKLVEISNNRDIWNEELFKYEQKLNEKCENIDYIKYLLRQAIYDLEYFAAHLNWK